MPLVITTYASLLQRQLQSKPVQGHICNGSMLGDFCRVVATGVIRTLWTQNGQVVAPSATGASSGVGILCPPDSIAKHMKQKAIQLFGQEGPALQHFAQSIGKATQIHLASASLSSNTNGPVKFPALVAAVPIMAKNIQEAGGMFRGEQWPNFAEAIAYGICLGIGRDGTGSVAGATGGGTGSGVVSIR